MELETYMKGEHPYPQYLRHHISLCSETLAKQSNIAENELASDGFPEETAQKAISSSAMNGHTNINIVTDTRNRVKSGTVFGFILPCFSIFWSTLRQSQPNKADLKCPSVRAYVFTYLRTSIHKTFLRFQ